MKALTLKSFLNDRERVKRNEIIEVDEARFRALSLNGLVKAAETPPEPAGPAETKPAPMGEAAANPKQTHRPKRDKA